MANERPGWKRHSRLVPVEAGPFPQDIGTSLGAVKATPPPIPIPESLRCGDRPSEDQIRCVPMLKSAARPGHGCAEEDWFAASESCVPSRIVPVTGERSAPKVANHLYIFLARVEHACDSSRRVFVVSAWQLQPDAGSMARGFIPALPDRDLTRYAFLAVSIVGATVSPHLLNFYASRHRGKMDAVRSLHQSRDGVSRDGLRKRGLDKCPRHRGSGPSPATHSGGLRSSSVDSEQPVSGAAGGMPRRTARIEVGGHRVGDRSCGAVRAPGSGSTTGSRNKIRRRVRCPLGSTGPDQPGSSAAVLCGRRFTANLKRAAVSPRDESREHGCCSRWPSPASTGKDPLSTVHTCRLARYTETSSGRARRGCACRPRRPHPTDAAPVRWSVSCPASRGTRNGCAPGPADRALFISITLP